MFIPPKTVRVIYNVFIHGLIRRSGAAASRGFISQFPPPPPSNPGSPSCSFRIWIGHCGLSVYKRYKHSDLFTLSPKVNHFRPNTLFSTSFIIHPKTNILHFFVQRSLLCEKIFRKALIMGDWSFRSLGDIIDGSNFQSVPPCDKLVNRLTNTHHPHFYIWSFPEAFTKECPLSRIPYWNWTVHMCTHCSTLRLWTCGALNRDERVHFRMHLVESKSGRKRFNFLDDFPSKLKC